MGYRERNFGKISASKLKCFLTFGPEVYYKQYELELGEEKDEDYFILGTAFDFLLSYGEDAFFEKYAIKEKLLKTDLEKRLNNSGIEFMKGTKVADLEKLYYGDRKLLTASMGEKIIGMYREAKRQPLADLGSEYEPQVELTAKYKSLNLKGTLDRLSLEKGLIRDWKTSGNLNYFEYDISNTFDYVLSMSFYYILVKLNHGINCDVILDVFGSTPPYAYYGYKLNKDQLLDKIETKIKPGLDALIECYETGVWESVYPITYTTEGINGEIITHEKGSPISRTKLMKSGYYDMVDGGLQNDFICPKYTY